MDKFNKAVNSTLNKLQQPQNLENTTEDENGNLICNVCGKEKRITIANKIYYPKCNCDLRKFDEQDEREAFERRKIKALSRIPLEYRGITFADSDNEESIKPAKKFVEKINEFLEKKVGLYIYGNVGTGKTFVATAIANELAQKGIEVYISTISQTLADRTLSYFDKIYNADVVVLDDFGTQRSTDYSNEQLYNLINYIYINKKVLIITTNIPRATITESAEDMVSQRICDRIVELTFPYQIVGVSRRTQLAKENYKNIRGLLYDE